VRRAAGEHWHIIGFDDNAIDHFGNESQQFFRHVQAAAFAVLRLITNPPFDIKVTMISSFVAIEWYRPEK
jgi:hypothetical protein